MQEVYMGMTACMYLCYVNMVHEQVNIDTGKAQLVTICISVTFLNGQQKCIMLSVTAYRVDCSNI